MNSSKVYAVISVIMYLLSMQSKADSIVRNKEFDSIDNVIESCLKKDDNLGAMKSLVAKGKVLSNRAKYSDAIIVLNNAILLSKNGTDTIKYPEMKELYMECLNVNGMAYSYSSRYDVAIQCGIDMDKYNSKCNNPIYKAKFYNLMGVVFATNRKLDEAHAYYNKALMATKKLGDGKDKNAQLFVTCSNLGAIFIFKKEFDSAQIYFMEAQRLAVDMKDKRNEMICLQCLGLMNANTERCELAIQYYKEAYKLALECKDYYILALLKINISTCNIVLEHYSEAMKFAFEGLALAKDSKMKTIEIAAMQNIALIYKQTGDMTNAFKYLEESNIIKDSLFSQDNEDKFSKQKTDFDTYKVSVEKEIFEKNMKLYESQQLVAKLIIFIVMLLLITVSAVFSYNFLKQYKLRKHERQKFIDEKKSFEDELEKKDKALSLSSISLAKSDELIPLMNNKLKALKTNLPLNNKGNEVIKEIEEMLAQLSNDSSVAELNDCLRQIPADFYDRLDILFPELTMSEKKICGLMSFGFSAKEIASMMGKSTGAMASIKFRIKMKIKADSELDLCEYFMNMRE